MTAKPKVPGSSGAHADTPEILGTTIIAGAGGAAPLDNTSSSVDRNELIDDDSSASKGYVAKLLARFLDEIFPQLYPQVPEEDGLKASRHERLSKGYKSVTLTYGEVSGQGVSFFTGGAAQLSSFKLRFTSHQNSLAFPVIYQNHVLLWLIWNHEDQGLVLLGVLFCLHDKK